MTVMVFLVVRNWTVIRWDCIQWKCSYQFLIRICPAGLAFKRNDINKQTHTHTHTRKQRTRPFLVPYLKMTLEGHGLESTLLLSLTSYSLTEEIPVQNFCSYSWSEGQRIFKIYDLFYAWITL